MKFALDTNVFTSILEDSDRIVTEFLTSQWNDVLLSAINVAELGATRNPGRRVALLEVAQKLWQNRPTLKFCPHLLNDSLEWYESGCRQFVVSVTPDSGLYVALDSPDETRAPEVHKELEEYTKKQKEWLRRANDQARLTFAGQLEQLPKSEQQKRFNTWSELYRFVENVGVGEFVGPLLQDWPVKCPKAHREPSTFLQENPFWRLFLVALTLSIWNRVFRRRRYGRRYELGSLDVQQVPYLPMVDTFVTSDPAFRRAITIAREFSPNRPGILSYQGLKGMARKYL